VVLGLLSLTRENALVLVVPVLSWLVLRDRVPHTDRASTSGHRAWLPAAMFLAGCAVVLLPIGARNYAVGGEFHLTTSQFGPNFYIGNHAGARGLYDAIVSGHGSAADERDDATREAEAASGRTLSPSEVSSFWTGRALEFIRAHPGAWLRQLGRKLALTYNAVEIADTESQEVYAEWSPLLRALRPFNFGVIVCLAAVGVVMTSRAWRRLWFLYAIAFTYTVSIIIFYVFARYRFPLVPVLLLCAAGGVAALRDESPRPMRWWAAGALLGTVVFTYVPLESTRTDRIVHYVNIANVLSKDPEKSDQAMTFYQKALDVSPRSPAAHLGIGVLLAQQDRPREAIVHYRTAVAGWPDNADLRLNLAVALAHAGDLPRALDELAAAARLRPGDPTPHVIAGRLLLEAGRAAEADAAFDRAVSINPHDEGVRREVERTKHAADRTQK
jgi:tetratricopeptide (TPR) repeat protein